jgi:hypothetical protein
MKTKPFQYREITGHWRQKHDDKNAQNEPNVCYIAGISMGTKSVALIVDLLYTTINTHWLDYSTIIDAAINTHWLDYSTIIDGERSSLLQCVKFTLKRVLN